MENIINFISNIDNSTYNKIRHSKSDAECRRYLKEQLTKQLTLTDVVDTLVCDIVKGTRCKDSFANYRDGVCYVCGGQAN